MGNLVLKSLEIQNFRGFHHLQIERLGRVNLIVGKNNVGKTSLLAALQLYANDGNPSLIWQILCARDESAYHPPYDFNAYAVGDVGILLLDLKYLFYGRKDIDVSLLPISIGPTKTPKETLSIAIGWYAIEQYIIDVGGSSKLRLLQPEEYDKVDNPLPRFNISVRGRKPRSYPLQLDPSFTLRHPEADCISITSDGLGQRLAELWDKIVLSELEEEVLVALRIMAPGLERLSFTGDNNTRQGKRIPIVRIKGINEPIPLRSLGGGMLRLLGIALALVNAKDSILLIDEFENGLYYAIQPAVWQLIFRIAERLNIQAFATTHSWDCIEGFQQAAQNSSQEGLLIRLQYRPDEITATLYDEEDLAIATREQIEVR